MNTASKMIGSELSATTRGFRFCVYGAQFGSEGKGCVAEWLIDQYKTKDTLVVFGENAPNSGHTNSRGKTRSLPVSAFFADVVMLGPDSAIDPHLLTTEINKIRVTNPNLVVYVHENAAIITDEDVKSENHSSLIARVASTGTGGGSARTLKAKDRNLMSIMRHWSQMFSAFETVDRVRWFELLVGYEQADWLFECSQGLMLDLNLGYYPSVTSRTTHPRAAIERNGLGPSVDWSFIGTHRTYPIRTGGNSGVTGGKELKWEDIGVKSEIATVTGRTRRVFDFSGADFLYSLNLVRPQAIAFTHLDYLPPDFREADGFLQWLGRKVGIGSRLMDHPLLTDTILITSDAPSMFRYRHQIGAGVGGSIYGRHNPFSLGGQIGGVK